VCITNFLMPGKATCLGEIIRAGALFAKFLSMIQRRRPFVGKIPSSCALKFNRP